MKLIIHTWMIYWIKYKEASKRVKSVHRCQSCNLFIFRAGVKAISVCKLSKHRTRTKTPVLYLVLKRQTSLQNTLSNVTAGEYRRTTLTYLSDTGSECILPATLLRPLAMYFIYLSHSSPCSCHYHHLQVNTVIAFLGIFLASLYANTSQ